MASGESDNSSGSAWKSFLITFAVLAGCLTFFFAKSFQSNQVIFSNDGPLGVHMAASAGVFPDVFYGIWSDLNWVGGDSLAANPGMTSLLFWIFGPVGFAKFYCPIALLMFGLSVWFLLRTMGFNDWVCLLGAVAAALNGNRFSVACWGLPSWVLCATAAVLALAALVKSTRSQPLVMSCLAGLATGISVSEGFDTGALLSLLVAAYGVFLYLSRGETVRQAAPKIAIRMGLVVLFAGLMAAHIVHTLVSTQIKGIAGTAQDEATKKGQWEFATQWSFPKLETLRLIIPGLYGYRMDTPEGGSYWGSIGRSATWKSTGQGIARHSGSGEYAGLLVVLLAAFALIQSIRKSGNPYSEDERKQIWFWSGTALLCLLLAFGRHAPVFQFFYAVPYMSTIRSPLKFLHIVHLALVILFAYGAHGLFRLGAKATRESSVGISDHLVRWWKSVTEFDRRWVIGLGSFAGLALFITLAFSIKKEKFSQWLTTEGIDATTANAVSHFAVGELAVFLGFLVISALAVVLIQSGYLSGRRQKISGIALVVILAAQFFYANRPWVHYWDYTYKYQSNAVVEFFKQNAHEHRVSVYPFPVNVPEANQVLSMMHQLYAIEWTQHLFPYNNVQTIDLTQEPRTLEENKKYRDTLPASQAPTLIRLWELTNTKWILGLGGAFAQQMGPALDNGRNRFVLRAAFHLVSKKPDQSGMTLEDITVMPATNGSLGLLEFTGALPRAKLFSNWLVTTNEAETLSLLTNAVFDPHQTVIVNNPVPMPRVAGPNQSGTVTFQSYNPREIVLEANAAVDSVLLLNDKHSPKWSVYVNDQATELLRCNYLMRGVLLPPGKHKVVFRFEPKPPALKITVFAIVAGLVLLVVAVVDPGRKREDRGLDEVKGEAGDAIEDALNGDD
ncbi:MAG: hypothetical protein CMO80_23340 [Verrucomicrobiales bacterium]|nr:hypothetical protein [Verrucomicrobiales bacterium]